MNSSVKRKETDCALDIFADPITNIYIMFAPLATQSRFYRAYQRQRDNMIYTSCGSRLVFPSATKFVSYKRVDIRVCMVLTN